MWLSVSSAIRDVVERAVHQNALSFLNVSGVALGSGGPARDFLSHCAAASSIQGTKLPLLDLCGHDEDSWSESLKAWLRLPPPPLRNLCPFCQAEAQWLDRAVCSTEAADRHYGNLGLQTHGFGGGRAVSKVGGGEFPPHTVKQNKPFYGGGGKPYENNCSSEEKEVRI